MKMASAIYALAPWFAAALATYGCGREAIHTSALCWLVMSPLFTAIAMFLAYRTGRVAALAKAGVQP